MTHGGNAVSPIFEACHYNFKRKCIQQNFHRALFLSRIQNKNTDPKFDQSTIVIMSNEFAYSSWATAKSGGPILQQYRDHFQSEPGK